MRDVRWLAGWLEGEGCFDLTQGHPRIVALTTDEDVVQRAAGMLGVPVYARKRHEAHWKQAWFISARGSKAEQWMMTLYALLGNRRRAKIREVLASYRVRQN